jgi:hypothetical protein
MPTFRASASPKAPDPLNELSKNAGFGLVEAPQSDPPEGRILF